MQPSEDLPRGLCSQCDALVYDGADYIQLLDGTYAHRGCGVGSSLALIPLEGSQFAQLIYQRLGVTLLVGFTSGLPIGFLLGAILMVLLK